MQALTSHQRPAHHPDAAFMAEYAAGALDQGWSLLLASHLAYCPDCREVHENDQALGGALLDGLAPAPMQADSFDLVMARAHRHAPELPPKPRRAVGTTLPSPLLDFMGGDLKDVSWRWVMPGLEECVLMQRAGHSKVSLLKIAQGRGMPRHAHEGNEGTLVLSGGFVDQSGSFTQGDVSMADEAYEHRPVAMRDEPCICLVVTDAPLRLTGPVGRLFNRFLRA